MESGDRLVVRKIFLGSAVKFGLIFGVIFAIIGTLIVAVGLSMGINMINSLIAAQQIAYTLVLSTTNYLFTLFVSFLVLFLAFFIGAILSCLVYNISAMMGGALDVSFVEKGEEVRKVLSKNGPSTKAPEQKSAGIESLSPKGYIPPKLLGSSSSGRAD